MIDIKNLHTATELQKPRRVVKYVMLWCSSGSMTVIVDEEEFILLPNTVITITSGQVHFVKDLDKVEGFVLEFTYDFFCKDDNSLELIFHNGLFCHFAMNEVIALSESGAIANLLTEIKQDLAQKPYQYLFSIHSRIELILIEINRCKLKVGGEIYKPDALFLKFLEAVRTNFRMNFSAKQIAALSTLR